MRLSAFRPLWRYTVLLALLTLGETALADEPAPATAEPTWGGDDAAVPTPTDGHTQDVAPTLPWQYGPRALKLGHDVALDLPAQFQFLAMPEAGQVMEKMGNLGNENLLGLVVSSREEDEFFVILSYDEEGFIKDDEEVDADDILEEIKDGEDDYNEARKQHGFGPIHVDGWFESPKYDKAAHHLVWGLNVRADNETSLNYNTRILGRRGYVSVNVVTDQAHLAQDKVAGATILRATHFGDGGRYQDFNEDTDKVAEYGLTGLVIGGAGLGLAKAAKIGLIAKFGKLLIGLLIAGKKALVLFVVGALAVAKKFFGRKTVEEPTPEPPAS